MSDSRVFFSHTVAAMFLEAFQPSRYPGLIQRFRELGLDVEKPLLPAYDYAIWRNCLEAQREFVFPQDSTEAAAREQGARYVAAYFSRTPIGGALLVLLRVIGPRRALERMTRNFRSANNFSNVSVVSTGPKSATLKVNDVFSAKPDYIVGMLEHGLSLMGTKAHLRVVSQVGDACEFEATWE